MKIFTDRRFRLPRIWSNREIRKLAPLFSGDIVNISGWEDRDKENGHYKDYFTKADSYSVTNYSGTRGLTGTDNEVFLDLSQELPEDLVGKYDICFNHTTLEHIFDFRKAFSSICSISRDNVLIVVPFAQTVHESDSFKDFWRFTPSGMRYLFEENGMSVVYEAASPDKNAGIYLIFVGSKNPEKWKNVLPPFRPIREAGGWIGSSLLNRIAGSIKRIVLRK